MEAWTLIALALAAALLGLWLLANFKTSRPDGDHLPHIHPYRRMLWFIMPSRNESVVYFDDYIDATNLLGYLERVRERFPVDMTHAIVAAASMGFVETPEMNRFVAGYRMYQREGIHMAFSMKRAALQDADGKVVKKAKVSAVKQEIEPGMSFEDFCRRVDAHISRERSGVKTSADKEYSLFFRIPRPLMFRLFKMVRQLDYWNLLPGWFLDSDPMHCSMFIANLGSLGMGAGYHHLYEWGTCPLFMMVGKLEDRPVAVDGEVVVRPMLHVRFSFDERIDDGMTAGAGIAVFKEVLLDPERGLGCLRDDGSDAWDLSTPRAQRGDPRPEAAASVATPAAAE